MCVCARREMAGIIVKLQAAAAAAREELEKIKAAAEAAGGAEDDEEGDGADEEEGDGAEGAEEEEGEEADKVGSTLFACSPAEYSSIRTPSQPLRCVSDTAPQWTVDQVS